MSIIDDLNRNATTRKSKTANDDHTIGMYRVRDALRAAGSTGLRTDRLREQSGQSHPGGRNNHLRARRPSVGARPISQASRISCL